MSDNHTIAQLQLEKTLLLLDVKMYLNTDLPSFLLIFDRVVNFSGVELGSLGV